jgi:four helix bundle protein
MYKFESLEVWELSFEYVDMIYRIAAQLPETERYNLYSQLIRAGTSITLNIAEGSTGQSDKEQGRFLGMAIRSLLESVACVKLIERRNYITKEDAKVLHAFSEKLFAKLTAFKKAVNK